MDKILWPEQPDADPNSSKACMTELEKDVPKNFRCPGQEPT